MLQILHAVKQIHTKRKKAVLWQRPGTKPGTSFCQMYSCSPVQKTAFRPDSASGGRLLPAACPDPGGRCGMY